MRAEETTFRRRRLLIFVAAQHNPPFLEKVLSMGRARPRSFDREAHRNDAVEVWSGNLGRRSRLAASLFALVAIGLSGCADYGLRRGPSAVLDATSIETAASNQIAIVNALALDAGFESGTPVDYYRVTEAGFNYVDDQCRAYFDEMYFIDRARSQTKSGLAAASATTVAILGLANASTMSFSIVASAFGFASSATDILAGTYLYALPPATTQGLVNKLQTAYRDAAANVKSEINTPTSAYHHIQSYLALCLPPTIEQEVIKAVSGAGAKIVPGESGSTFSVESVGAPAPATPKMRVRTSQNPPPTSPLLPPEVRVGAFELALRPPEIRALQKIVCIGQDGRLTAMTRKAILDFLGSHQMDGRNLKDPSKPNAITDVDDASLHSASDKGIGC